MCLTLFAGCGQEGAQWQNIESDFNGKYDLECENVIEAKVDISVGFIEGTLDIINKRATFDEGRGDRQTIYLDLGCGFEDGQLSEDEIDNLRNEIYGMCDALEIPGEKTSCQNSLVDVTVEKINEILSFANTTRSLFLSLKEKITNTKTIYRYDINDGKVARSLNQDFRNNRIAFSGVYFGSAGDNCNLVHHPATSIHVTANLDKTNGHATMDYDQRSETSYACGITTSFNTMMGFSTNVIINSNGIASND